ncbi:MAG: peptidase M16 [Micavibrio sp.]|nr:peptidase M16 [Micavibrio sp.]|tara:strand:+ start:465 stop:1832 length:1368 start_codon:yes stop_codon:yes gene_type:complete
MRLLTPILLGMLVCLIALPQSATARDKVLDIKEVKSESGITAWLVEDHSIPVISLQFAFKGAGSVQDPEGKQGLARLLSNTMDEGAGDLPSEAFQKELRDLSISLSFGSSRDNFSGTVKTLTQNKDRAFELMRLALSQPRFDEEPVARMRAANQSRIRSSLADPGWIAARIMNDVAYDGHAYALNSGGTISSLEAITPDDLRHFAKTHLSKDRLRVAASGDITAEELKTTLDQIFSALPDQAPASDIQPLPLQNKGKSYLYTLDIPQTMIEIQQGALPRKDERFHHAQIMNFVLGSSGFGSRLTEEIREKRGLTYGIYSYFSNMDYFDGLAISTSTANKNAGQMLKLVTEQVQKMRSYPITEEELKNAKSYLIGSLPLSLTSTDRIAGLLLSLQMDELGLDYLDRREKAIQNATTEDIFKVSQKILAPENFVTVLVGTPEGVDNTVKIETIPNVE